MNYVLKKGKYYLSDYELAFNNEKVTLLKCEIGIEYQRLFSSFETAEAIRKLILDKIGIDFTVKKF